MGSCLLFLRTLDSRYGKGFLWALKNLCRENVYLGIQVSQHQIPRDKDAHLPFNAFIFFVFMIPDALTGALLSQ